MHPQLLRMCSFELVIALAAIVFAMSSGSAPVRAESCRSDQPPSVSEKPLVVLLEDLMHDWNNYAWKIVALISNSRESQEAWITESPEPIAGFQKTYLKINAAVYGLTDPCFQELYGPLSSILRAQLGAVIELDVAMRDGDKGRTQEAIEAIKNAAQRRQEHGKKMIATLKKLSPNFAQSYADSLRDR